MDLEALQFRASCLQATRSFFQAKNYLELDTPALSPTLIPETCLEVFKTTYINPFKKPDSTNDLFLVPSPEVWIKPIIAKTPASVFQLSKCYRNGESIGRIHSPEFTMLEYYTMQADYKDSIRITEAFLQSLAEAVSKQVLADKKMYDIFTTPFLQLTMDEAFIEYAGFSLARAPLPELLAAEAQRLGLGDAEKYASWAWDDLYELILVHTIEPNLPKDRAVALLDYPARVPCLAQEQTKILHNKGNTIEWKTKERWEVYVGGIELANCYSEERNQSEIDEYIRQESKLKQKEAFVPHPPVEHFGEACAKIPPCSGVAMGFDRLVMLLAGKASLESIIHSNY